MALDINNNPRKFAMDQRGGGQTLPPYLQGRSPNPGGQFATKPMITPKAGAANVAKPGSSLNQAGNLVASATPGAAAAPGAAVPGAVAGTKPVPQTLYDFFKGDLERQRKSAMSNAITDASARGVYYGTPLTTSQGDIQTEYLRGLGQLQANVLQNEQQNELARLGLGANLLNSTPQVGAGGIDPAVFQTIGTLFGGSPSVSGERSGPVTPKQKPLTKEDIRK